MKEKSTIDHQNAKNLQPISIQFLRFLVILVITSSAIAFMVYNHNSSRGGGSISENYDLEPLLWTLSILSLIASFAISAILPFFKYKKN